MGYCIVKLGPQTWVLGFWLHSLSSWIWVWYGCGSPPYLYLVPTESAVAVPAEHVTHWQPSGKQLVPCPRDHVNPEWWSSWLQMHVFILLTGQAEVDGRSWFAQLEWLLVLSMAPNSVESLQSSPTANWICSQLFMIIQTKKQSLENVKSPWLCLASRPLKTNGSWCCLLLLIWLPHLYKCNFCVGRWGDRSKYSASLWLVCWWENVNHWPLLRMGIVSLVS